MLFKERNDILWVFTVFAILQFPFVCRFLQLKHAHIWQQKTIKQQRKWDSPGWSGFGSTSMSWIQAECRRGCKICKNIYVELVNFLLSPYLSWLFLDDERRTSFRRRRGGGGGPVFGPREFMALTKQNTFLVHFSFWGFYMLLCQVCSQSSIASEVTKISQNSRSFLEFC